MSVKLLKINVKNKILFLPKDIFHILHNTYINDNINGVYKRYYSNETLWVICVYIY